MSSHDRYMRRMRDLNLNEEQIRKLLATRSQGGPKYTDAVDIVFEPDEENREIDHLMGTVDFANALASYMRRGYLGVQRTPDLRMDELEVMVNDLKQRLEFIEATNKEAYIQSNWFEIVAEVITLYSHLPYVTDIYARKADGTCDIWFLHDSEEVLEAQREIIGRTLVLEERFPRAQFDYMVLQKNEAFEGDLSTMMQLYTRR